MTTAKELVKNYLEWWRSMTPEELRLLDEVGLAAWKREQGQLVIDALRKR